MQLFDAPEPTRPPGRLRREVDAKRRLREAKAAIRAETNTKSEVKRVAPQDLPPELAEMRQEALDLWRRGDPNYVERYMDFDEARRQLPGRTY